MAIKLAQSPIGSSAITPLAPVWTKVHTPVPFAIHYVYFLSTTCRAYASNARQTVFPPAFFRPALLQPVAPIEIITLPIWES